MFAVALAVAASASSAPAAAHGRCLPRPPNNARLLSRPRWLADATVTEYYPVRESWFAGRFVRAPGLPGRHRARWLYGPHGVAMNGEGLARDGHYYHFAGPWGGPGWVNRRGEPTGGCWTGRWTNGAPAWLGGWRAARFAPGRSSLPFWQTVAVDRHRVPYGSRVFISAYCDTPARGWFRALDTGGAIIGDHFDVYRAPPRTLVLHSRRRQHVYVLPPGFTAPRRAGARCPARHHSSGD